MTISSCLNFGRPTPPGRVLRRGKFFGSASLQPARSVCVSSQRFSLDFAFDCTSENYQKLVSVCMPIKCALIVCKALCTAPHDGLLYTAVDLRSVVLHFAVVNQHEYGKLINCVMSVNEHRRGCLPSCHWPLTPMIGLYIHYCVWPV